MAKRNLWSQWTALFCVVEDEVVCYKNAIIHLLPRLKTRLNNKGIYVTDLKKALHFLP